MAKRKLSEHRIQLIAELRDRGLTFTQIKQKLEAGGITVSTSAISWHCLRLGADPPNRRRPSTQRRSSVKRGNHMVRPFSPADDRNLLALEATGQRISEIARALKRKPNSIRGRLYTLARREARAEELENA